MAILRGVTSGQDADVGANSKGLFMEQLDPEGGKLFPKQNGFYSAPIRYTASAADAAGNYIFAIRNSASKILTIRRLYIVTSFNGTAAATTQDIEVVVLSGITADSGGTAVTPGKKRTSWPASTVTSVRGAGLVTLTGAAVAQTLATLGTPRQVNATGVFDYTQLPGIGGPYNPIEIDAGAGNALALRLNVVAVIGDSVRGMVEWEER